jgi:asparagine synthase (glutamine-hydrolysing)
MCGIFGLIETKKSTDITNETIFQDYRSIIKSNTSLLYHRGPDSNGNNLIIEPHFNKSVLMLHTRLKITGNDTKQPLTNSDNTVYLIINGEIFNWKSLETELNYQCLKSDCEIVLPLYEKYKDNIPEMLRKLKGQFSFFLYDIRTRHILIARDPIGVTPLYIGYNTFFNNYINVIDNLVISSELKCMTNNNFVKNIQVFPPRSYIYSSIVSNITEDTIKFEKYLDFEKEFSEIKSEESSIISSREKSIIMGVIRDKLIQSVRSQLRDIIEKDLNFGVLLSGGLDSSLITSLVVSIADEMGYTKKIKTFSIGIDETVPDLVAARTVANYLNTDHHEYHFTADQGINSINDVIWYAESYDCTTIRASTPMYLLTKCIKQTYPDLKVLFSGELSDELLCYLYGANAPNEHEFQLETIRLVNNVHLFDCLRANKMCMANSIEVRVPFTDEEYVKYILSLHPKWKTFGKNSNNQIEKQILRDSFRGFLPKDILYRKKEQFSDGVSSLNNDKNNWINTLKNYSDQKYTQDQFEKESASYSYNKPVTREHLLYRSIFCKLFDSTNNTSESTVKIWEPNWSDSKDPSGRIQDYWIPN